MNRYALSAVFIIAFVSNGFAQSTRIQIEKELFITDLAVVNSNEATDPTGAFHVKTLFTNMAPAGKNGKDVLLSMLNSWEEFKNNFPIHE